MSDVPALKLDATNHRFVGALLHEHLRSGTMPQGWEITRMRRRFADLGMPAHAARIDSMIAGRPATGGVA